MKKKRIFNLKKLFFASALFFSILSSPLSANRGYWFGNKHFSQCNEYLVSKGKIPIEWNRVI